MDEGITYAARALFGKRESLGKYLPQAEIIFEYRSSEASGPASQREEFRMGFFACYNRLWELINLRNDKQHYQDGFFVYDIPTFNERVVREAILSAIEIIKWVEACLFASIRTGLRSRAREAFPMGFHWRTFLTASCLAIAV